MDRARSNKSRSNKSGFNKCYLYLLDTMADWEIAYLTAELNSGRYLIDGKTAVGKVSADQQMVKTMGGMQLFADRKLSEVAFVPGDFLILPGADTWAESRHKPVIERVEELLAGGVVVAAICGATVALAGHGVLNTRRHTSNDKGFLENFCPAYQGSHNYVDAPVVCEGNLITASGLAALDFSYQVMGRMRVMKPQTLQAWYELYRTRQPSCFHQLTESLK